MNLPHFRYHPDPLKTGSIKPSEETCIVCGQTRGYEYTGSVYSLEDYIDCVCPWCIADGSAAKKLDAEFQGDLFLFTDSENEPKTYKEKITPQTLDELCYRTPSYPCWQSKGWFYHCGDAGAFLSDAGYPELLAYGEEAIASLKAYGEWDDTEETEWQAFLKALNKHGSSVAYVFQCLHCGKYGVYQDCD